MVWESMRDWLGVWPLEEGEQFSTVEGSQCRLVGLAGGGLLLRMFGRKASLQAGLVGGGLLLGMLGGEV